MKTFKDLEFKGHLMSQYYGGGLKQAVMHFANNYGVSVLLGNEFYSNGVDTYEVAILYKNEITYNTEITNDVLGYVTKEEVSEIMKKIQLLK